MGIVTREDIKHMKARVDVFRATHVVATNPDLFDKSPACAEPWCRWVLIDSVAYAARGGPTVVRRACREPLALPLLPGEVASQSSTVVRQSLTEEDRHRIQANREQALQRKRQRQSKDDSAGSRRLELHNYVNRNE